MLEKFHRVNNPLTIIAIFAGLAEISGTGILPFLDREVQHIYVWFLMGFPVLLVGLFFATSNFNHKVLYAPSDYRSDEGFLVMALTPYEKQLKVEREAEQIISEGTAQFADRAKFVELYQEAEHLVRRALEREYGQQLRWDVKIADGPQWR